MREHGNGQQLLCNTFWHFLFKLSNRTITQMFFVNFIKIVKTIVTAVCVWSVCLGSRHILYIYQICVSDSTKCTCQMFFLAKTIAQDKSSATLNCMQSHKQTENKKKTYLAEKEFHLSFSVCFIFLKNEMNREEKSITFK